VWTRLNATAQRIEANNACKWRLWRHGIRYFHCGLVRTPHASSLASVAPLKIELPCETFLSNSSLRRGVLFKSVTLSQLHYVYVNTRSSLSHSGRRFFFRYEPSLNSVTRILSQLLIFQILIRPVTGVYYESDRFLSVKKFLVTLKDPPYILSFSKMKYKHLFYKLESIFMNFHRFF